MLYSQNILREHSIQSIFNCIWSGFAFGLFSLAKTISCICCFSLYCNLSENRMRYLTTVKFRQVVIKHAEENEQLLISTFPKLNNTLTIVASQGY